MLLDSNLLDKGESYPTLSIKKDLFISFYSKKFPVFYLK
ncbi:MAG: hypothetical protein BAJALOKI2v1_100014 [Promethearchaeota archaeon]|nr:MAG: hypothetical protein BAJALOKI2v1_100014 [Candidatus Lokiarchaeota archaeon]